MGTETHVHNLINILGQHALYLNNIEFCNVRYPKFYCWDMFIRIYITIIYLGYQFKNTIIYEISNYSLVLV